MQLFPVELDWRPVNDRFISISMRIVLDLEADPGEELYGKRPSASAIPASTAQPHPPRSRPANQRQQRRSGAIAKTRQRRHAGGGADFLSSRVAALDLARARHRLSPSRGSTGCTFPLELYSWVLPTPATCDDQGVTARCDSTGDAW